MSHVTPPPSRREYLRHVGGTISLAALSGCTDSVHGSAEEADSTDSSSESGAERNETEGADEADAHEADEIERTDETDAEESDETGTPVHADYETVGVRIETPAGEPLGSVTAAVADTAELRYLGLSDTESLPEDRGMLFVYDEVAERTFVMRDMDFGIDIVFADDEGVVTEIHHAPEPGPDEDGSEQRYPGRGQYVLEVNYEWTAERGIETGHVLRFDC